MFFVISLCEFQTNLYTNGVYNLQITLDEIIKVFIDNQILSIIQQTL